MSSLVDPAGLGRRRPGAGGWHCTALIPLMSAGGEAVPPFRIERLGEDRLRLTMAAAGLTTDDIEVFTDGGLLHIETAADAARGEAHDYTFLMLEPMTLSRVELEDDELVVELERDHATPCLAVPPPMRRESADALALAA